MSKCLNNNSNIEIEQACEPVWTGSCGFEVLGDQSSSSSSSEEEEEEFISCAAETDPVL